MRILLTYAQRLPRADVNIKRKVRARNFSRVDDAVISHRRESRETDFDRSETMIRWVDLSRCVVMVSGWDKA